jgi:hypothetical protein
MTKLRVLILILACALIPATARADDGGWWEWLQGLSGPKLMGAGTEVHVLCLDKDGHPLFCEKLWGILKRDVPFDQIKHQLDFRFSLYWNYGEQLTVANATNTAHEIMAAKLMAMYFNRVHPRVSVGAGAGVMPFFGRDFNKFARGIVTPVSVIVTPYKSGGRLRKAFYIRAEESYITQGFSAADFGNTSTYSVGGSWNGAAGIGFDFRRR